MNEIQVEWNRMRISEKLEGKGGGKGGGVGLGVKQLRINMKDLRENFKSVAYRRLFVVSTLLQSLGNQI